MYFVISNGPLHCGNVYLHVLACFCFTLFCFVFVLFFEMERMVPNDKKHQKNPEFSTLNSAGFCIK